MKAAAEVARRLLLLSLVVQSAIFMCLAQTEGQASTMATRKCIVQNWVGISKGFPVDKIEERFAPPKRKSCFT